MYALLISPELSKKDSLHAEKFASNLAKTAQSFRLEAQVFQSLSVREDVQKAYAAHSSVFVAFGDQAWLDNVITQSVHQLPKHAKLPAYARFDIPAQVPILHDQFTSHFLRQYMGILAARRLNNHHLYRYGDNYFLDTVSFEGQANSQSKLHLYLDLVNDSQISCELEASVLTFQAYTHAEHPETPLLYLTAERPNLQGADKLQTDKPIALLPTKISLRQNEPILRLPVRGARITGTCALTHQDQPLSLPMRIAPLPDIVAVIEAKKSTR